MTTNPNLNSIAIYKFWHPSHTHALIPMVMEFLKVGMSRGGDLSATQKNAELLIGMGMARAELLDPCYIATVPITGEIVSYIQWHGVDAPFDCRWKTLHTFGAYTIPKYRNRGVADRLRHLALEQAKKLGYERVIGPVHMTNSRGVEYFVSEGAWPTTVQFELLLETV